MVSISISAASLGSNRIEGRVMGRFWDPESVCMTDLIACNCEAIVVAMVSFSCSAQVEEQKVEKRELKPSNIKYKLDNSVLP